MGSRSCCVSSAMLLEPMVGRALMISCGGQATQCARGEGGVRFDLAVVAGAGIESRKSLPVKPFMLSRETQCTKSEGGVLASIFRAMHWLFRA